MSVKYEVKYFLFEKKIYKRGFIFEIFFIGYMLVFDKIIYVKEGED